MSRQSKVQPLGRTNLPPGSEAINGQVDEDASRPAVRLPDRWWRVIICLLLALAVWVVFGQTARHGFVNLDDSDYVFENSVITHGLSLNGIVWVFTHNHAAFWHPLTSLSHMLDCQLYGLNAAGHHVTNVLLHTANVMLLFLVLRRMTGAMWPSAFVAGLFAIHPLRVESVAWVAERKDVLSGLFFMLTLLAYVRYVAARSWGRYVLVIVCLALGLMAKPMLVTLPFVLLLLDYWPLRRFSFCTSESSENKNGHVASSQGFGWLIVEKIPLVLLVLASAIATICAQHQAGAIASVTELAFPWRFANAAVSYVVYIGQMVFPHRLAVYYPHLGAGLPLREVLGAALALLTITVAVVLWCRRFAYLLVGWFWYLGMLVPVIGLIQVGGFGHADRFTYLSQIGLYIVVAWGAMDFSGFWRYGRAVLCATAVAVLTALLMAANVQTAHWRDSVSLWTHALACTSGNALAHNNLGGALVAKGKLIEAIRHYGQALQLKPDYAEAYYNLGVALAAQGKLIEAIPYYEWAIRLKPDYTEAHNNLGGALAAQGKLNEALQSYGRALQLKPDYAEACYNSGAALAAQERLKEAIPYYERAIRIKPDYAEAHNNLGVALAAQKNLSEAIQHYERALRLKPDYAEAQINLGAALAAQGRVGEAIRHYQQALQLKRNFAAAHVNLASALASQGQVDEAIQHFQQALHLLTVQGDLVLAETIRQRLKVYQSVSPQSKTP